MHLHNPLNTPLPKAPSMAIYCLYGTGAPTERAYRYLRMRHFEVFSLICLGSIFHRPNGSAMDCRKSNACCMQIVTKAIVHLMVSSSPVSVAHCEMTCLLLGSGWY